MALIDTFDRFDAERAAEAGMVLSRLLWVRGQALSKTSVAIDPAWIPGERSVQGPGTLLERTIDRAIKAINLVAQSGVCTMVVLDLIDVPGTTLARVPRSTWLRLQRVVEGTEVALLLMAAAPVARSAGGLSSRREPRLERDRAYRLWEGLKTSRRGPRPYARPASTSARACGGKGRTIVAAGSPDSARACGPPRHAATWASCRSPSADCIASGEPAVFAVLHASAATPLDALVEVAQAFTPRFQVLGPFVLLDVGGLSALFGTPGELGGAIRQACPQCRAVALGSTASAALLLACGREGLTVLDPAAEKAALAELPYRHPDRGDAGAPERVGAGGAAGCAACARLARLRRHPPWGGGIPGTRTRRITPVVRARAPRRWRRCGRW